MYEEVKLNVKTRVAYHYHAYLVVTLVISAGIFMSYILFSLFINDIEFNLQNGINAITLEQISISVLLFAGDAILFSEKNNNNRRIFMYH